MPASTLIINPSASSLRSVQLSLQFLRCGSRKREGRSTDRAGSAGEAVDSGHLIPPLHSPSLAAPPPRPSALQPPTTNSSELSRPLAVHSSLLPAPAQPPPCEPRHYRAAGQVSRGGWGTWEHAKSSPSQRAHSQTLNTAKQGPSGFMTKISLW